MEARRLVILDRDGTLVPFRPEPRPGPVLPGVVEALRVFRQAGATCVVATNQPGCREDDVAAVHAEIGRQTDGAISRYYVCSHAAGCTCRKPAPWMLYRAIRDHGADPAQTWMIGDDVRDVLAADVAGVHAALVLTGRTDVDEAQRLAHRFPKMLVFPDLLTAARRIEWT